MFVNDLDFESDFDGDDMVGRARIGDVLRTGPGGNVRPSVLATLADIVAGRIATIPTDPRLALTLDIDVRILVDMVGDEVEVLASIIKAGRTTVATEALFRQPGRPGLVAIGELTFIASPRPQDLNPTMIGTMRQRGTITRPLADDVGIRIVGPGVAEIDRSPRVTQLSGTLQGGIVALLGEVAAESLIGRPVRDLSVRYLTTVRVGPGRATATEVADGLVRVEVRDTGRDDRLAAMILARTDGGAA